jgi:nudix-type nucleoside diphosphatase (YffH/AdpP family)
MHDIFIYGTLCHPPMLAAILGHGQARAEPARLAGHAVRRMPGDVLPMLIASADEMAHGLCVRGLGTADLERLDWFEAGFGYSRREILIDCIKSDKQVFANAWFPPPDLATRAAGSADWSLPDWVGLHGDVTVEAGRDAMAARARGVSAEQVAARWPQMLVRAASRLRACADPGPTDLRRAAAAGDVAVEDLRAPYAAFFAVEEADLRLRRFDGVLDAAVTRAVFVIGDAVTVLPYDPLRDRVLIVEQFRAAPQRRGDPQPWSLEPVAGRIDGFETPEQAARRETQEEAGIALRGLLPVAQYYPSPGAVAEFLYSYVGLADLPREGAWLAGLAAESEDIRAHVIGFDRLMALVASGEVRNAPLLLTALWLSQRREGLRQAG